MDPRLIAASLAAGCLFLWGECARAESTALDPAPFPEPARNAISFWGHASCYIDVDGFGIVTDPVFGKTITGRRRTVAAPPPERYAGARIVLISHSHTDHFSPATLATFPPGTIVLCPPSAAEYIDDIGLDVRVMKPGDEYPYPGGRIVAVVAHHAGGRWGVTDRADGRALGWVIETPHGTVYYSGDTEYFEGFADVGKTYRPDVVILSLSGHLHSTEAVSAAFDTRARFVIPVHHGAYGWLFFGERKRPRNHEEMERLLGSLLVTLDLGESFPLPGVAP